MVRPFPAVSRACVALCEASVLAIGALFSLGAGADPDWPGLSPDCWSEPRMVHAPRDATIDDYAEKHTKTVTRPLGKLEPGRLSPNKAYFFVAKEYPPGAKITIYAEKNHLVEINFSELRWIADARWINEKLIFWRVWWGRIAASDMIYDVEAEKFIYTESVTDGGIAWRQYRDSCPRVGCDCIKKQ